jgi:predicted MFS family arabinose efflux permease
MQLMAQKEQQFSWFIFSLMASVTFMAILSELAPSGILPEMSQGLGVDAAEIGFLVGIYALASAVFTIPLISATLAVNRKKLLLWLLVGFAISNIIVGLSSSYYLIVFCRIVGGICAGLLWPMIAAYGTRLVPPPMHGRAITVIMAGATLGISLGLPMMTAIGTMLSWRAEFIGLGLIIALIAVLSYLYLPSLEGEKLSKSNSPFALLKMPAVLIILALTFLAVLGHYAVYTYITLLVETISFRGGIELALIIFGVGSVVSVIVSAYYIDQHLRALVVSMLGIGAVAMATFMLFSDTLGVAHLAFFLWGLAFGPVVTMFQAAISKQVQSAKDVATSIQSSTFNFSIMIASYIGGLLLTSGSAMTIVYLALLLFIPAVIIAFAAKRTLR